MTYCYNMVIYGCKEKEIKKHEKICSYEHQY
nr:MAG TPA: hypothetical protein [Caudoviricetes sp.]